MNDMEILCKLEEITKEELMKVAKKGEVAANEWQNLDHVVNVMKNVKKVQMMLPEWEEGSEGYSSRSYNTPFMPRMTYRGSYENQNDGMSNMRGRSRTTGRYMSRDSGRSMHSIKDRAIAAIERMYDEAPTDHERTILDDIIHNIEMSER